MANIDISNLKLQFNNEILKVKKFILQAKTQIIHKLTRDVEKLKKKKGSDEELKKFGKKSDSIVSEIMFIKKINHSDLGRFAIKNFTNLVKIMDTPIPTEEKAMAKLLSHKCLKSRFQEIVNQFSIVPPAALLQVNPKKLRRKEKKMKAKMLAVQENNVVEKNCTAEINPEENKSNNVENATDEDMKHSNSSENISDSDENQRSDIEGSDDKEIDQKTNSSEEDDDDESDADNEISFKDREMSNSRNIYISESDDNLTNSDSCSEDDTNIVPSTNLGQSKKFKKKEIEIKSEDMKSNKPQEQNAIIGKDKSNANQKKFRKMFVDLDDTEINSIKTEKTVDSFFMTDSGDNYLTLNLPRKPDAKPSHLEDSTTNRKMRRAALFGNEVKSKKVRKSFNKSFDTNNSERYQNYNESNQQKEGKRKQFDEKSAKRDFNNSSKSKEDEKLHPSWEAKKKKSTLVQFEGRKVVFDD